MPNYTHSLAVLILVAGSAGAQNLTEFGAAAAGGAIGAASGKAVSNGIDAVFTKLNDQTVKAAGKEDAKPKPDVKPATGSAPAPLISTRGSNVGPLPGGSSRGVAAKPGNRAPLEDTVPPPPPLAREARPAQPALPTVTAQQVPFAPLTLADALPAKPIDPPPTMTPETFKEVEVGMHRADVLKLGEPSSRIQMFDDGHMVELFSYRASGERFGRVRLEDGAVAKIENN